MRKRDLAAVLLVISLYAGIALVNKTLVDKADIKIDQQQAQINSLRDSYTEAKMDNLLLDAKFKSCEAQLTIAKQQIQTIAQSDSWYMEEGIATAYSPLDNQNGIEAEADGNITSTGVHPGPGIIAVDPARIPYNSEIIAVYADGTIYRGVAGDTGGALRSSSYLHIDIYRDTFAQAVQHGNKAVMIFWKLSKEAAK